MSKIDNGMSPAIQLGEVFFRYRDYTPIPLIILLLIVAQPSVFSASIGLSCIFFGELLRIYSVSFIGPKSRTRSKSLGDTLVEKGPYAFSRNPLYLANFFICLGFSCYSGKFWFVLLASILLYIQYYYIILFEETLLVRKFAGQYQAYCSKVSRFFPKSLPRLANLEVPSSFFQSISIERRTLLAIVLVLSLLVIKSL